MPKGTELPEKTINIMTDGYAGYNALSKMKGINNHAVCWAHARRKFVDASHGRTNTAAAHQMVSLIAKLYQIEQQAKEYTAEQRKCHIPVCDWAQSLVVFRQPSGG